MIEFSKNDSTIHELKVARFLSEPVYNRGADMRFHANHIKVEKDGRAVSTDGSRLHHVRSFECFDKQVPPGYYKVVKRTKTLVWLSYAEGEDDHEYPDPGHV